MVRSHHLAAFLSAVVGSSVSLHRLPPPPKREYATKGESDATGNDPPLAFVHKPVTARAEWNQSIPSSPRRTLRCSQSAHVGGFPPAPGAHCVRAETRTNSPESRLQRSAPRSAEPPSAQSGPAPLVCPTAAVAHLLWECRRAVRPAADRFSGVDSPEVPPAALTALLAGFRSVGSSLHLHPLRRGYGARVPMPLAIRLSCKSGHTRRKTGIVVPAWPFGLASVSAERVCPAVRFRAQFPLALQYAV